MKPISIGDRMVAVAAAIAMTTGMAGGLAALAKHHADRRIHAGATVAQARIACEPARTPQPDAAAGYARTTGS